MEPNRDQLPEFGQGVYHPSGRPMQVILDKDGCMWLCDKGVDPSKDLDSQGCWRCKDLQFTRND